LSRHQQQLNVRWQNKGDLWIIPYVVCRWFSHVRDQRDLVCPAYMALAKARETYDGERKTGFATYATTCVRQALRNYTRSARIEMVEIGDVMTDCANHEAYDCNTIARGAMLGDDEANSIRLYYGDGMTYRELAIRIGVSVEGARTIVSRGVMKMRRVAVLVGAMPVI
jgi:RNA polymerase sigma factor (sigma-70 family)